MTNDHLLQAISIAIQAHGLQLDKAGELYILHPFQVMLNVDTIDAKIVAVLHDTIEDTTQTLTGLRTVGFTEEIVNAVDAISKRKNETNAAYWLRVRVNKLAREVKLADIEHNLSEERLALLPIEEAEHLRAKYTRAKEFLTI